MISRSSIGIALLAAAYGPCDRSQPTPSPSAIPVASTAAVPPGAMPATSAPAPASGGGGPASCDLRTAVGYCLEFDGATARTQAKGNCDSAKNGPLQLAGTYAETACPTAGRIGTCVAVIGGVT